MHPRAVEIARNYGVTLVVRSSWTDEPGTRVVSPRPQPRPLEGLELAHPVDAVEFDTDQAKVALLRIPDRPGIAARLFGELAGQNLNVDLIIQSIHEGNTNDIAFTMVRANLARAEAVAEAIAPALRSEPTDTTQAEVMVDTRMAKISIAGAGMIGRPGVAARMFSTLAEAGINIQLISHLRGEGELYGGCKGLRSRHCRPLPCLRGAVLAHAPDRRSHPPCSVRLPLCGGLPST